MVGRSGPPRSLIRPSLSDVIDEHVADVVRYIYSSVYLACSYVSGCAVPRHRIIHGTRNVWLTLLESADAQQWLVPLVGEVILSVPSGE